MPEKSSLEEGKEFFLDTMVDLKYHLLALLDRTGEEPYNELLKALLLGERSGLPEEWEASLPMPVLTICFRFPAYMLVL